MREIIVCVTAKKAWFLAKSIEQSNIQYCSVHRAKYNIITYVHLLRSLFNAINTLCIGINCRSEKYSFLKQKNSRVVKWIDI